MACIDVTSAAIAPYHAPVSVPSAAYIWHHQICRLGKACREKQIEWSEMYAAQGTVQQWRLVRCHMTPRARHVYKVCEHRYETCKRGLGTDNKTDTWISMFSSNLVWETSVTRTCHLIDYVYSSILENWIRSIYRLERTRRPASRLQPFCLALHDVV